MKLLQFEKDLMFRPNKTYPTYIRIVEISDIGSINYKVKVIYDFGYGKTRGYWNEAGLIKAIQKYDPFQNIKTHYIICE